ncbi:MAG: hypothetical protein U9Q33_04105 [Campylobacterota bacterium]|nr:hypothetical protein [Campylobacterota bacterium]
MIINDLERLLISFEFVKNIKKNISSSCEEYKDEIEKLANKHYAKLNIFGKVTKRKFISTCIEYHFKK